MGTARMSGLVELSEQAAKGTDALRIIDDRLVKHKIYLSALGFIGSPWECKVGDDRETFPTFAQAFAFAMDAYDKALSNQP